MTFQPAYAVDGGPINGVLIRRQLQSATRGAEGIVENADLQVRALPVPGAGFRVGDGAAVVRGRSTAWDGSYYALNIGDHVVSDVTGTGSSGPRSDMVVARIVGTTVDPYIIQGVPPAATTIAETSEPGLTAIPLARIDWPASTGTITQGMIKDLRQMLQPRSQRVLRVQRGGTQTNGEWDEAGDYTANFERWPQHEWTVEIPAWATQAQILSNWDMGFYKAPAGMTGAHDARGQVRTGLVNMTGGPVYTLASSYNFNPITVGNGYSVSIANRDQVAIPATARGSTATLRMYAKGDSGQLGRIVAGSSAHFSVDIEFLELPAPIAVL